MEQVISLVQQFARLLDRLCLRGGLGAYRHRHLPRGLGRIRPFRWL